MDKHLPHDHQADQASVEGQGRQGLLPPQYELQALKISLIEVANTIIAKDILKGMRSKLKETSQINKILSLDLVENIVLKIQEYASSGLQNTLQNTKYTPEKFWELVCGISKENGLYQKIISIIPSELVKDADDSMILVYKEAISHLALEYVRDKFYDHIDANLERSEESKNWVRSKGE